MDSRCRLCLTFSSQSKNLFASDSVVINLKEIVKNLTGIKIDEYKEFPSSICISCMDIVNIIINFRDTILKSQKILENEKKVIASAHSLKSEINSEVSHTNELFYEEIKVEEPEWNYDSTQCLSSELTEENSLNGNEDNESLKKKLVKKREKTTISGKKELKKSKIPSLVTHDLKNSNNLEQNVTHEEDNSNQRLTTEVNTELSKQENISDEHIDSEFSKSIKSTKKRQKVKNSNAKQKRKLGSKRNTAKAESNKSSDKNIYLENQSTEKSWRKYKASYEVACHICGKMISKFIIENHLNTHLGRRPYKCDVENCNKTFPGPTNLYQHKLTHNKAARFKCNICGKCFKLKPHLKKHMTYHFDPQLPCNICGKLMRNKDTLKLHILRHENKRTYKCDQCESAFNTQSSLRVHLLTHTGLKPYKCDTCGKDFRYKQMLKTHCEKYH